MTLLLLALLARARGDDRERGDVPGWVLITIMTAGLVTVLWAFAEPTLRDLLDTALDAVTGPGDA
ncbi:MAG: hypothetical protein F2825_00415 [Actinobacteria bacterium]|uniref:Unannotated protein n=1 Tax=freshwater metagenome TaxID=449393 RepID=A0A6J7FSR5_9ZZZZ|nr:hypothetical protein [Actinomycetota bacterium]